MSEDKMNGAIDAKRRRKAESKRYEWGLKEYRNNPDGSVQGYEEYYYTITNLNKETYDVKGTVRWWRKG